MYLHHKIGKLRRYGQVLGLLLVGSIALQAGAVADSVYDVSINTASLSGTGSTLAFDFLAGGGAQSNSVSISNFSTDGTLGSAGPNSGSVTGSLPGTVTLSNSSFFNENLQGITLGSTLSFQIDATNNAPAGSSIPDTFSFFLLDPTATTPLLTTTDPTGADSLFTLQIDGSPTGILGVYGSVPSIPVTVTTPTVTLPTSLLLMMSGLIGIGVLGIGKAGKSKIGKY